jgi:hypothetical protein
VGEGLLLIQTFPLHQRPLARSINTRESKATWNCSARAPLSSALTAAPSRLATTPAYACKALTSVSPQPRGAAAYRVQGGDGAATQLHRHTQPGTDPQVGQDQGDLPPLGFGTVSCLAAGRAWAKASMQGPWPKIS